jgi:hypothetical protein
MLHPIFLLTFFLLMSPRTSYRKRIWQDDGNFNVEGVFPIEGHKRYDYLVVKRKKKWAFIKLAPYDVQRNLQNICKNPRVLFSTNIDEDHQPQLINIFVFKIYLKQHIFNPWNYLMGQEVYATNGFFETRFLQGVQHGRLGFPLQT